MNTDKKIKKIIDDRLDDNNFNYVLPCQKLLEDKKQQIFNSILHDYSGLKNDINLISLATTLNYKFTDDGIYFSLSNSNIFSILVNDGKYYLPKKNGFNILYFEIIDKYKDIFEEIAILYKKIKPYLLEIKKLDYQMRVVNGNILYELYLSEEKYNKQLSQYIKNSNINLNHIREQIYGKTGWYYIDNDIFGRKDVDNNIVNGVILMDKWLPYSTDKKRIKEEELFIVENINLLNNYRLEKRIINEKTKEKDIIFLKIENEINNRNNLIDDLKKDIISKEKIQQKVI